MSQFYVFGVTYLGPHDKRMERFAGCTEYLKGFKGQEQVVTGPEAPAVVHAADLENQQRTVEGSLQAAAGKPVTSKPEWAIRLISEPMPTDTLPPELLAKLRTDAKQATATKLAQANKVGQKSREDKANV